MNKEQLEQFREKKIKELHITNDSIKSVWNNRSEQTLIDKMYAEDLFETENGKYDKSMYSDLFCPQFA